MKVMRTQQSKPYQPTFGILKGYKKTPYGEYTWGVYKNYKIEVYDAFKERQKLHFVSSSQTLKWLKSKFSYVQNGIKRVINCSA
jgi:hypothetical protein